MEVLGRALPREGDFARVAAKAKFWTADNAARIDALVGIAQAYGSLSAADEKGATFQQLPQFQQQPQRKKPRTSDASSSESSGSASGSGDSSGAAADGPALKVTAADVIHREVEALVVEVRVSEANDEWVG